jgi:UDP-GlcNAc:undecaprenyl-phosphate/decaprenyl-phosphate GlcNAc-1-phosphate transferase
LNYVPYLYFFLSALAFSFLLTPTIIRLAHKHGFLDEPGHRKIHVKPVAYFGGVAVFLSLCLALGTAWPLGFFSGMEAFSKQKIAIVLACALGMALVGLWDDLFHVRARYKFLGQLFFATLFALYGFRFEVLHIPGIHSNPLDLMAVPLTVFWLLSIINALNMVDGVDGLASSVVIGSLFLICMASALIGNPGGFVLCLAAFGAVLGFLKYNWTPAKIYLGDAGSNGLGMLIGGLLVGLGQTHNWLPASHAIGHSPFQPFQYQVFVVTLLIAYPALEILLSVSRRLFHGRPISRADKGHLHHRLQYLGWSNKSICLAALCFTLLLGGAAIATLAHQFGKATWLLVASGILLGLALPLLGFLNFLKPYAFSFTRPHFLIVHHFISMQRAKLSLAESHEDVLALIHQVCAEFGVQGYNILVPLNAESGGDCHVSWERSLEDHRDHLSHIKTGVTPGNLKQFKDHTALKRGKGIANWVFEPHTEEEELDVEYRVLVSEFMREALAKIASLKPSPKAVPESRETGARITSTILRRRHRRASDKSLEVQAPVPPEKPTHN